MLVTFSRRILGGVAALAAISPLFTAQHAAAEELNPLPTSGERERCVPASGAVYSQAFPGSSEGHPITAFQLQNFARLLGGCNLAAKPFQYLASAAHLVRIGRREAAWSVPQ